MSAYLPYDVIVSWDTPVDTNDIDTIEIYRGPVTRSCDRIIEDYFPIYTTTDIYAGTYRDTLTNVGNYKYIAIARNKISYTECSIKLYRVWPDSDGDGIKDKFDDCPELMGTKQLDGCPGRVLTINVNPAEDG